MQAIEFESIIHNKTIQIPFDFNFPENKKVKIIILYPEVDYVGNYNKGNFLHAIANARSAGVFNEIKDSVEWQKKIRDEWE